MEYSWKPGSRVKLKAQVVGEHLTALRERRGGRLFASDVVIEAKRKRSVLHDYFEWDDATAAGMFRVERARYLIGSVEVTVVEEQAGPVRAFVSVTTKEVAHFTTIAAALSDEELRSQVLAQAFKDMEAFTKKYRGLEELVGVLAAMERAKK
jgi:hypothetical protein